LGLPFSSSSSPFFSFRFFFFSVAIYGRLHCIDFLLDKGEGKMGVRKKGKKI
jgi:hypothetical protein